MYSCKPKTKKKKNKTKERKSNILLFSFFITYKKKGSKWIFRPNINSNNVQIINLEFRNHQIEVHVHGS